MSYVLVGEMTALEDVQTAMIPISKRLVQHVYYLKSIMNAK